jgi:hypothetical protein
MQERLVIGELTAKLARAVHGRVDGPREPGLQRTDGFYQLAEGHVADDHQINVAGGRGRPRCK